MIKFFIILLLLNVLIFAGSNSGLSIDMQISRIKNAPANERVRLMNAFKQRVYRMNYEDRSSAIREIQAKMYARTQKKTQIKREMKRREIIEHASEMQSQNSDDIASYQNMNQQQIKNLIAKEKIQRKDGKISKFKIVKQILKTEMEEQDIRIPSKQNIKIIKEQIKDIQSIREPQTVKIPNKQIKEIQNIKIVKEQIKEIQASKLVNEQAKKIQSITAPNNQITNQISDTNQIEQNIDHNHQIQEFYLKHAKRP